VSEALEDRQLLTSITDVQGDFNLGGQIQSFVFEIGGLQPGETSTGAEDGYDQINVSGRLFGTADIEVKLLGGFEPQAGQVFTLMTYDAAATDSTSSHFFDSATGLYGFGDGSLYFDVVQDVNKIQLVVSELGTPSLLKSDTPALNDFLGEYYSDYFTPVSATINGSFNISDYVYVTGSISLGLGDTVNVDLNETIANGDDVEMQSLTIGIENASAFIGVGGPYQIDSNSDGVLNADDAVNVDALGFVIQDLDLGLALLKPVKSALVGRPELASQINKKKYLGLKATANQVGFVGFGDDFKLELNNLEVGVNISSGGLLPGSTTIDWASSFPSPDSGVTPAGFAVNTGGVPVYLDFEGRQISATTDAAILQISEFVHVSGSFAFEKGDDVAVIVDTPLGAFSDVPVPMQVMTIGARDVSAFVGSGGPYRQDADGNLRLDESDPINADATGLVIDNLDLGIAILRPSVAGQSFGSSFYAMSATASTVGLVGIDDFKLEARDVAISVNKSGTPGFAVDFGASFPAINDGKVGYPVRTGTTTVSVQGFWKSVSLCTCRAHLPLSREHHSSLISMAQPESATRLVSRCPS
jgi:hypothetical protein